MTQSNEEIIKRIDRANADRDSLQHVKLKYPPRVFGFLDEDGTVWAHERHKIPKEMKQLIEYVSLSEHHAELVGQFNAFTKEQDFHMAGVHKDNAAIIADLEQRLGVAVGAIEKATQVAVWLVDDCKLNNNLIKSSTVNAAIDVHDELLAALEKIKGGGL